MRKIGISNFSTKPTNFYKLDFIISVGYRLKSLGYAIQNMGHVKYAVQAVFLSYQYEFKIYQEIIQLKAYLKLIFKYK